MCTKWQYINPFNPQRKGLLMLTAKFLLRICIVVGIGIGCFFSFTIFHSAVFAPPDPSDEKVIGESAPENLQQAYERWKAEYASSSPSGPAINIVWNKGLSSEFNKAKGIAEIDLENDFIRVRINGLEDPNISEVWLVDNLPGPGRSALPESGDKMIHAGSLQFKGANAWLRQKIDPVQMHDFEVNWVVVTRRDTSPDQQGILYGSTSLFQRIYHYPDRTPLLRQLQTSHQTEMPAFLASSAHAHGITPYSYPDAKLINLGRKLFFNETFNGNGRTCGSCHPENNNFTIDPKFIAALPDDDPLFVAEFVHALSDNFEKPELMRKVGLILENTNGFGDLVNNFTMRSVPHLLAMKTSLNPPMGPMAADDGTTIPPDERTGWSGDGSPVGMIDNLEVHGSLRDFAVGAVVQHFPKTLGREPGEDFRLPTQDELDALEAFQLSLGRQVEFDDFRDITLTNEIADRGRLNYMGEGLPADSLNCNACHFNGGANTDPVFVFSPFRVTPTLDDGTVGEANRSFAPRNEELLDQAGDIRHNPFDDGFGSGTNLFNVPTVIEAADTGPFFHGNSINTVEAMVAFYSSPRHLRNGDLLGPIVPLNGSQVANVGAFLRVLNADENARSAIVLTEKALEFRRRAGRNVNLRLALAEIEDAMQVLDGGNLHYEDAIPLIKEANNKIERAIKTSRNNISRSLMQDAIVKLDQVREAMIIR